jgi:hypothetical protein
MRIIRMTAATLLVVAVGGAAAAAGSASAPSAPLVHTCSIADKHFILTARLNLAALGDWSDEFLHGDAKARDVVDQAETAVTAMQNTAPEDSTLRRTRVLLRAMFDEYASGVQASADGKRPGRHIYRAYGLANFAHDLLVDARPALQQRGCDVSPLL